MLQLSADDLEEFGWEVSEAPPSDWNRTRKWVNKRVPECDPRRRVQVPVGIDPGFQHNVGLVDIGKDASNRLIAKIDAADPDLGRAAVGDPSRARIFRRFLETAARGSAHGDFAIGMLDGRIAGAIGAQSKVIRLSGETAAKQAGCRRRHDRDVGHPEVTAEDYALVQRIVDEGEWFQAGDRHAIGLIVVKDRDKDRVWKTVVKSTLDGSNTYVQNLHRDHARGLAAARRDGNRIDR